MITASPIVEKRKRSSVGGRRANGLQPLPLIRSKNRWLLSASFGGSVGFALVNRSYETAGGMPHFL